MRPKLDPLIVTDVPVGPEDVDSALIVGAVTVKTAPLLAPLVSDTVTLPVVAPPGTGATIWLFVQLVGVAVVPLKLTVLDP